MSKANQTSEKSVAISTSAGRFETHDIEQFNESVPPWDVVMRQVSLGPFHHQAEFLKVGGMLMYREHVTRRMLVTGATPAGFFVFGGPTSPKTDIKWCGDSLGTQRLVFERSGRAVDFVLPDDSYQVVLLAPSDLLLSFLDEETRADMLSQSQRHLADSGALGIAFLNTIDRMIGKYLAQPELLNNELECRAIERWVLEFLVRCIYNCTKPAARLSISARQQAFRRAIDYCRSISAPVPVRNLATAAGISQRHLARVFRETLGTSPHQYMQTERMNAVHRALRAADRESTTVTDLAQQWGFTELGRFAGAYMTAVRRIPLRHPGNTSACTA
jgi:AraC-like DNA-binding protein